MEALDWMSDEQYTGTLPTVIALMMGGYAFDLIGRRWTLAISFVFTGIMLWGFILVSPNKILFLLCSGLFTVFMGPLGDSPLIMDYVCKESIGSAISMRLIGVNVSVLVSTWVLWPLVRSLEPMIGWAVMAGIFIVFGLMCFCIVADLKDLKVER